MSGSQPGMLDAVVYTQVGRSNSLPHAGSAGNGKQAAVKAESQPQQDGQAGSGTAPGKAARKVSTSESLQADGPGSGKRQRDKDSKALPCKVGPLLC
jgi:hypothetical protein